METLNNDMNITRLLSDTYIRMLQEGSGGKNRLIRKLEGQRKAGDTAAAAQTQRNLEDKLSDSAKRYQDARREGRQAGLPHGSLDADKLPIRREDEATLRAAQTAKDLEGMRYKREVEAGTRSPDDTTPRYELSTH